MECLIFHIYQNSRKIDADIVTCDKIILKISFYKISMMMSMLALVWGNNNKVPLVSPNKDQFQNLTTSSKPSYPPQVSLPSYVEMKRRMPFYP
jgi:hypothetical protein